LIVVDTRDSRYKPLISIITATYNATSHLPKLIESIKAQIDRDFEWVVADGASSDDTLDLLRHVEGLSMVVHSRPDCGIYDAFNSAIRLARGEYYVICGADDILYANAIDSYKQSVAKCDGVDVVVGAVRFGENIRQAFWHPENGWRGAHDIVTRHSVGMLIKTGLHQSHGEYSLSYKQCADALFIKKLAQDPHLKIGLCPSIVGSFGLDGVSNNNVLNGLCEGLSIQLNTEKFRLLQVVLFALRLVKNIRNII